MRQAMGAMRTGRLAGAVVMAALLASCGVVPRAGPSKDDIYASSVLREGDAFIVEVNGRVTAATSVIPALGFSSQLRGAAPLGADTIRAGDTLSLIVYENVEDGLLSVGGAASLIDQVQVDDDGFIFVPYAGRIQAAGNTPEALRGIITERLNEQTPDPQVVVRRVAGNGATVSVVGLAGAQGIYPIQRPTQTLTALLATAGGATVPPEVALVSVSRGGRTETARLVDLYRDGAADIALRDGDRIFIEQDDRTFTALGATGVQTRLEFATDVVTAVDALAQVGGLNGNLANPTGVFVLRNEPQPIAAAVLGRDDLVGPQRMIYVLDLTEPNGLFNARDFVIQDGDTIYVTEARIVAFNRSVAALFGSLGQLSSAGRLASDLGGN